MFWQKAGNSERKTRRQQLRRILFVKWKKRESYKEKAPNDGWRERVRHCTTCCERNDQNSSKHLILWCSESRNAGCCLAFGEWLLEEVEEVLAFRPLDKLEEVLAFRPLDKLEEVLAFRPLDELEEVLAFRPLDKLEEVLAFLRERSKVRTGGRMPKMDKNGPSFLIWG